MFKIFISVILCQREYSFTYLVPYIDPLRLYVTLILATLAAAMTGDQQLHNNH